MDIEIKEEFAEIKKMINDIAIQVNNINICLNGQYKQKGLVSIVQEHTDYMNSDKRLKAQLFGGFTVITIIWGVIVRFWDNIFGGGD